MNNGNILLFPNDGAAVTPNDGADLPKAGILYVGTSGDVKVDTLSGSTLIFKNVQSGNWLDVRVKKVYATNTTAADMNVMYDKYD